MYTGKSTQYSCMRICFPTCKPRRALEMPSQDKGSFWGDSGSRRDALKPQFCLLATRMMQTDHGNEAAANPRRGEARSKAVSMHLLRTTPRGTKGGGSREPPVGPTSDSSVRRTWAWWPWAASEEICGGRDIWMAGRLERREGKLRGGRQSWRIQTERTVVTPSLPPPPQGWNTLPGLRLPVRD